MADELGIDPSPELALTYSQVISGSGRTPATRPLALGNQLPRDLPDFVGRAAEIDQVAERFGAVNVLVVSGPIGSGKSAFAVHIGHLVRDNFPDGQVMLDLAEADGSPKSVTAVAAELLDLIGIGGQVCPPSSALARWRSWIARRRLLLVLDNAVREDVVRAVLPGSRTSGVIVTSRHRLSGVESVLRVTLPPLTDTEGVELLGRIAGRGRVLADRRSATEILDCCEGLPLAVRIVGAKLTALRHLRLLDYSARFRDSPCVLDEMAAGELELRPRYEAFYRNLTELQKAAYHAVAWLPPPPFEHDQVIAALPAPGVRALESLFECHLLSAPDREVGLGYARYDMPAFAYWFCRKLA
ncbi:NB-ARC domain-containing protein [Fodinicola feengrottensis]|uniref:NB-ARC domain-containing protein n=1 Tax=Fodinicola feengrottensis TaxID=435914 RepID=UPI0013D1E6D6|nr:NB-ARC domain-containing protein [Fodinicola feengrottensis]